MPSALSTRGGRRGLRAPTAAILLFVLCAASANTSAQDLTRLSVDSAVSINQFVGQNAGDQPDIIVDFTASTRLGKGWTAYVRPWFRRASTDPYDRVTEIYQAALQHQHVGRVSTRLDLGYIISPIGLGILDMRADTNPTILPHLAYLVLMPPLYQGAPGIMPIASSYPLGGQLTASTTKWDARVAMLTSPPNRSFTLNAPNPNPRARPFVVIGGGVTPTAGLRLGAAFGSGEYVTTRELTPPNPDGRGLRMVSFEGEWAFRYTKLSAELTHDSLDTFTGPERANEWFVQGMQTLSPRWFVAARQEGAAAPPLRIPNAAPQDRTLRVSEMTVGYRLSRELTLRGSFVSRKLYFGPNYDRQAGASLVWARRWW